METRANYIVVGSFVLAVLAGLFVFTVWIAKVKLQESHDTYYVYFTGSVTGLQEGSPVRYRGIPVGTVTDVRLDPDNVGRVRVTVETVEGTPIMADSIASLEVQGLTGGAYVQINGGTSMSERLADSTSGIPVIPSRPSSFAEVVDTAPQILARLLDVADRANALLSPENQAAFAAILANTRTITGGLADASGDLRQTMESARTALAAVAALADDLKTADVAGQLGRTLEQARTTLAAVEQGTTGLTGDVREMTRSFRRTSEELSGLIADNREPVRDFTASGLYELTLLITQLRDLSGQLSRVVTRIENDPSNFIFGGTSQGVEVRGR